MKFQALAIKFFHLIAVTYTYELKSLSDPGVSIDAEIESSNSHETSTTLNDNRLLAKNFSSPPNISDVSESLPFPFELLKDVETEEMGRNDTSSEFVNTTAKPGGNDTVYVKLQTTELGAQKLTTDTFDQNQTALENVTTKVYSNTTSTASPTTSTASPTMSTADVIVPVDDDNITITNAVIRQTLIWLNDSYTVALLIPISAGLVIASTIIVTVAACKCIRRRCYRKRLRRKILPEDVKNMRPSDRARLLAETSDDEF